MDINKRFDFVYTSVFNMLKKCIREQEEQEIKYNLEEAYGK